MYLFLDKVVVNTGTNIEPLVTVKRGTGHNMEIQKAKKITQAC